MSSKDLKEAASRLSLLGLMAGRYMDDDQDFTLSYSRITGCNVEEAKAVFTKVDIKQIDRDSILNIALMGYTSEDIESILSAKESKYLAWLILQYRIFPRK